MKQRWPGFLSKPLNRIGEVGAGFEADGDFIPLGSVKQPSGKIVTAWALEGDWDLALLRSNTFEMEWPPRSGKSQTFPEVDRAEWFPLETARLKILKGQAEFIDQIAALLGISGPPT